LNLIQTTRLKKGKVHCALGLLLWMVPTWSSYWAGLAWAGSPCLRQGRRSSRRGGGSDPAVVGVPVVRTGGVAAKRMTTMWWLTFGAGEDGHSPWGAVHDSSGSSEGNQWPKGGHGVREAVRWVAEDLGARAWDRRQRRLTTRGWTHGRGMNVTRWLGTLLTAQWLGPWCSSG
jgi:hypothetical protein